MPIWSPHNKPTQTIEVLLFEQFSNYCLANAIEPLRAANTLSGRTLYKWEFTTIDGGPVQSSSGLPVSPAKKLRDTAGGDYLFVMPSYGIRTHATLKTTRALRAAEPRFRHIAGFDTGSWLMACAGLLNGRCATIHWDELTAFEETFPQVKVTTDRVARDGRYLTCGGVTTAFDLVLDLIRQTNGEALYLEVASLFFHTDEAPTPLRSAMRGGQHLVDRATALMRQNLEVPLFMPDIAQQLCVSQRRLEQIFKTQFGATPRTVYKRLRLLAARRYVENADYPVAEIALRCGYQNAAAMTRAFVAEFAVTPSSLRRPDDYSPKPS
jgi:transcriptional regulator GlxA family with amidase domain